MSTAFAYCDMAALMFTEMRLEYMGRPAEMKSIAVRLVKGGHHMMEAGEPPGSAAESIGSAARSRRILTESVSIPQPQPQPQEQPQQQQLPVVPTDEQVEKGGGGQGGGEKGGGDMQSGGWRRNITAIAALITAVAALLTAGQAYINQQGTNAKVDQVQKDALGASKTSAGAVAAVLTLEPATAGTLEEGQKLCRVLQGKTWRDGIIVPKNWTIRLCEDYMRKTEGTDYQLGCVTKDNVYLALPARAIPTPNCGWN